MAEETACPLWIIWFWANLEIKGLFATKH